MDFWTPRTDSPERRARSTCPVRRCHRERPGTAAAILFFAERQILHRCVEEPVQHAPAITRVRPGGEYSGSESKGRGISRPRTRSPNTTARGGVAASLGHHAHGRGELRTRLHPVRIIQANGVAAPDRASDGSSSGKRVVVPPGAKLLGRFGVARDARSRRVMSALLVAEPSRCSTRVRVRRSYRESSLLPRYQAERFWYGRQPPVRSADAGS